MNILRKLTGVAGVMGSLLLLAGAASAARLKNMSGSAEGIATGAVATFFWTGAAGSTDLAAIEIPAR